MVIRAYILEWETLLLLFDKSKIHELTRLIKKKEIE